MSSTRLPGKVLKEINGQPMISWQIARILKSKVDGIILATSLESSDDILAETVQALGVPVVRGSIDDVLSRFIKAIEIYEPTNILRLTADCPLVMPEIINEMLDEFERYPCDYMSNTNPPTFPDGLDVEIVSAKTMCRLADFDLNNQEREHVTLGIYRRQNEFLSRNYISDKDFSGFRWTVDYSEDLDFVREVYSSFEGNEDQFSFEDVLRLVTSGSIADNVLQSNLRNITLSKKISDEK